VDIYHAREHLHDLAAHLAFITPDPAQWLQAGSTTWTPGTSRRSSPPPAANPLEGIKAEDLDRKLGYFEHNIHRMRYAHFKKLGMFTDQEQLRQPASKSSPSAPSSPACTGPSRRRRRHRPALPARQRPVGRTLALPPSQRNPAPAGRLTDTATQT